MIFSCASAAGIYCELDRHNYISTYYILTVPSVKMLEVITFILWLHTGWHSFGINKCIRVYGLAGIIRQ